MKKVLSILMILLFSFSSIQAFQNDCAVIATEVYCRLNHKVYWVRIIGLYPASKLVGGHCVCVWQIKRGGKIFVSNLYSDGRTIILDTTSHNPQIIGKEVERKTGISIKRGEFFD